MTCFLQLFYCIYHYCPTWFMKTSSNCYFHKNFIPFSLQARTNSNERIFLSKYSPAFFIFLTTLYQKYLVFQMYDLNNNFLILCYSNFNSWWVCVFEEIWAKDGYQLNMFYFIVFSSIHFACPLLSILMQHLSVSLFLQYGQCSLMNWSIFSWLVIPSPLLC